MTVDLEPMAAALGDPETEKYRAQVDELLDDLAEHVTHAQLERIVEHVGRIMAGSDSFGARLACAYLRYKRRYTSPAHGLSACLCEDGWVYRQGAASASGFYRDEQAVSAEPCPRCIPQTQPEAEAG